MNKMSRFFKKLTRKILFGFAALLVIGTPIAYLFLLNANNTQAAWYNDNWAYRKAITVTVTSSASDISNLQTLITVDTTGITAKVQSSCQDLRFTSATGALLPYYIDTCSNNSATNKIWVMADLVPKNTTTYTMYMYYGNPTVSSASDADTFWSVRNLKRYWTLNDTSGNTVTDSSVNASNGTATDANTGNGDGNTPPSVTTGQYGNARNFDGTDDYVPLSQPGITSAAFTVSFWANPTSGSLNNNNWRIIGGTQYCGGSQFMFTAINNTIRFQVQNTDGGCEAAVATASVSASTWVHIVGTFDGTRARIYKNGVLTATSSTYTGSFNTGPWEPFVMGRSDCSAGSPCWYYGGKTDEVRIYTRVLTDTEVAKLYSNPGTITTTAIGTITPSTSFADEEKGTGPTLYWKLDDGTGVNTEDSTSNNLDGTLNNTPTWQTEDQCIAGKCLYFNGTTNMNVSKSDDAKLDFAASDNFTVSAWVKRNGTSSANNFILTKAQSGYTGYKLYQDASGDYCFDVSDGTNTDTACTSAVDFDDDKWHLVQGVKAGTSSITLYVDGLSRATDSSIAATGTLANTGTFYVGVDLDGTSNEWLGFIDEVKVYPYARSAAQIKTDYISRGSSEGSSSVIASDPRSNLSNGLVGYWKMDEASGTTTVSDSSGNSKTGTSTGTSASTNVTTGKFGKARSFNGTDQYISATSIQPTNITVSAWVNFGSSVTTNHAFIAAQSGEGVSNIGSYFLRKDTSVGESGTFSFFIYNGSGYEPRVTATTIPSANTWYHVVGTFDGSNLKIYVNGVLENTRSRATSISYGTGNFLIGTQGSLTSNLFSGNIDETRIYNRALSSAEITSLYNFAPGPIAHYTFDDNTGSSVKDSSGNASTGTWTGSTTHWTPGKFGSGANVVAGDYVSGTLAESPAATTVSFWAKDSTSNTWHYYTNSGGTQYVDGVATSFTNKYYYLSGTTLYVGTAGIPPNDSTLSSGLKLWLKADAISGLSNGAAVSSWSDSSGNSNTFSEGTNKPTYTTNVTNNRPMVKFDGSNDLLTGTGASLVSVFNGNDLPNSIFLVAKNVQTSGSGGELFAASNNPTPARHLIFAGDLGSFNFYVNRVDDSVANNLFQSLGSAANTNTHVLSTLFSGTVLNGFLDGSQTLTNAGLNTTTVGIDKVILGHYTSWYNGYLGEVIVYNSSISSTNRQQVDTYLGCKYNVTISSSAYTCFNGVLDDFKVYNYARTQKQIVEDMNAGHPNVGSPVGSAVAHWKFDEGYGTTANDSSINSNALTLSSASWTNSGKFNKAWNGTGAVWLSRADDADFDFAAAEDMAISLWFKSDSATNPSTTEYLVNKGPTSAAGYAIYATTSGTICFGVDDDTTWGPDDSACTTADIYDGTWHHITATKTGTTRIDLFVDGVSTASDTSLSATGTLANSDSLVLGDRDASNGTDEFNGDLDEVKIYRYALTASEVKVDMNRSSSQVLGTLSDKSTPTSNSAAGQIYCIPGDTASCAGPVGEWNFEEGTGTSANDNTGNANTGTWQQGSTSTRWTTGKYGSAGNFAVPASDWTNATNGVNNYVSVPSSSTINNISGSATVEAWIYPYTVNSSGQSISYFISQDVTSSWNFGLDGTATVCGAAGRLFLLTGGGDLNCSSTAISTTRWTHVAFTHDGINIIYYVNGVQVATVPRSSIGTSTGLNFGRRSGDNTWYFNGKMDNVRIYNYPRSAAQIAWDYNFGKPVGWWKFNECQGSVANDSSGNSLTGTLTATSTIGTCTTSSTFWGGSGGTGAGKFNYAPTFNGTGDYFTIGNTSKTINSVSLWVKPSSTTQNILDLDGGTHTITVSSGTISANGFSSPTIYVDGAVSSTIPDTNWHLITVTTATGFSASSMVIGKVSTNYYSGQIDETQIYNYALTPVQVKGLYNNGAVRFGPSSGTP